MQALNIKMLKFDNNDENKHVRSKTRVVCLLYFINTVMAILHCQLERNYNEELKGSGWRDGSVVKSTECSQRFRVLFSAPT